MSKPKDSTNYVVGAVVVVILVLIGWLFITRGLVPSQVVGNAASSTPEMNASGESVSASDQAAGGSVAVSMTLTKDSWVAVKEAESVRVLGAARFNAGATSGTVPLLRNTTKGAHYQVVLYTDDGDRVFDMKKDMLESGASADFMAQ